MSLVNNDAVLVRLVPSDISDRKWTTCGHLLQCQVKPR